MFSADLGGYTAPPPAATDPPFQKVALLLHGDGTNGAQNNTFVDSSSNNFTITRTGNVAQGTFSPFAPSAAYSASTNGGSGYFDGSGDYLTVPANTSAFQFGTGDFCLECFYYYVPGNAYNTFFNNGFINGYVCRASGGTPNLYTNGAQVITSSVDCQSYAWNHVAFCRVGSTFSIFLNGVRTATITYSSSIPGAYAVDVGFDSQYYLKGYLSNNRIVKGSSPYDPTQSSIAVPTTPLTAVANTQLLLNCTNAGIIDNSGKNDIETVGNAQISTSVKKYGTGSMYFDGTGDYLQSPDRPEIQLGTGNFTIECWAYLTANGISQNIAGKGGAGANGWAIVVNAGNTVSFISTNTITSVGTLTTNTWYHIAVVRTGTGTNQTTLYINGVSDGVGTIPTDLIQTNPMRIGSNKLGSGSYFNGYIDDLRITKGQALYTSNFTPPTQAFPDV